MADGISPWTILQKMQSRIVRCARPRRRRSDLGEADVRRVIRRADRVGRPARRSEPVDRGDHEPRGDRDGRPGRGLDLLVSPSRLITAIGAASPWRTLASL